MIKNDCDDDAVHPTKLFANMRNEVISQIGRYCSELSHQLFLEFSTDLVPQLMSLNCSDELFVEFQRHHNNINKDGIYNVGDVVLDRLKVLVE